jgi:hypothetical protein
MTIKLNDNDSKLVRKARSIIKEAYESAYKPAAVARSIASYAVKFRNRGRPEAIKRHPFEGICEASGKPLDDRDKVLDELEPEKGYRGEVRWVCPKANNSGRRSCGGC